MKKEEREHSKSYVSKTSTGALVVGGLIDNSKGKNITETSTGAIIIPYHSKDFSDNSKGKDITEKSAKSKLGKKSRAAGQRFELKVRQDLENLGWIVSKWMNTVDYDRDGKIGKLVSAKRKYNPFMKVMTIGTGFPDFVCFKRDKEEEETIEGTSIPDSKKGMNNNCEVIGLEVKSNGYLDKIEKDMCIWLLENKIFSRILIGRKSKEGKGIEYLDFAERYGKK
jgi:hypothetical protein